MKEKSTIITCKICGKTENLDYFCDTYAATLGEAQMCHTCHHWHTQHQMDLNVRGEHNFAIIEGAHYVLAPDGSFKGYDGREFRIRFNDGYETACNNLWHQGDIPEGYWRHLMPDNAQFVWEGRA